MIPVRRLAMLLTTGVLVGSSTPVPEGDPVVQARAQRAAALNVPEGDLPPVPKGILEPPPLPPPEIHPKDLRGRRGARSAVKKGSVKGPKKRAGSGRKAPRKSVKKTG